MPAGSGKIKGKVSFVFVFFFLITKFIRKSKSCFSLFCVGVAQVCRS